MFVCAMTHARSLYERAALACGSHGGVFGGHFLNEGMARLLFINAGCRHFDIVPTARLKALINL